MCGRCCYRRPTSGPGRELAAGCSFVRSFVRCASRACVRGWVTATPSARCLRNVGIRRVSTSQAGRLAAAESALRGRRSVRARAVERPWRALLRLGGAARVENVRRGRAGIRPRTHVRYAAVVDDFLLCRTFYLLVLASSLVWQARCRMCGWLTWPSPRSPGHGERSSASTGRVTC